MFDRGYFDLKRLYHINEIEAYFVIRQRGNLQYEIINEGDTMHNADGVLSDQVIRLTNYFTKQKYRNILPFFVASHTMRLTRTRHLST